MRAFGLTVIAFRHAYSKFQAQIVDAADARVDVASPVYGEPRPQLHSRFAAYVDSNLEKQPNSTDWYGRFRLVADAGNECRTSRARPRREWRPGAIEARRWAA